MIGVLKSNINGVLVSINNKVYKFNDNKANTVVFPDEKVKGKIEENVLDDNIFLIKSDLFFNEETITTSSYTIDGMVLGFNIEGNKKYKSHHSDLSMNITPNNTNITLGKNIEATSTLSKGKLNTVNIIIKKEFLTQNLPEGYFKEYVFDALDNHTCNILLSDKITNSHMQLLLNEVISTSTDNNLNKIFIQSRVLEIIFSELNTLNSTNANFNNTKVRFDQYDLHAIEKAKEILINNIQNPPSILELSRQVKLNDFKLKIGFKKLFNTTPYGLLIEYRLDLAKKLLTDSDMNINEIAEHIGYKYHQSFSSAFMKRFGIKPKDLMKNRKYY